ncbi:proprotein convertase P-domain-containing protein [Aliikangiella sp. IMCC44359]|uniref:proprotein convertase P-domain-containing protein n=1 Tax=Aliikangiella sp. IMCC44359 TaxID=3459125 RepID=UPI00403AD244
MKFFLKTPTYLLLSLALSNTSNAAEYAQSDLWNNANSNALTSSEQAKGIASSLNNYRLVQSTAKQLTRLLASAPARGSNTAGVNIDLPLPNGQFTRFVIFRSTIMEPELAEKFPSIQTYWGYEQSNPKNRGRFDLTPNGFHAMFSYNGEKILIDPTNQSGNTYINYKKSDTKTSSKLANELVLGDTLAQADIHQQLVPTQPDGKLRTYRLAVATTGEYTQRFGGTVSGGLSAVVTAVNRVNEVYENDLAVKLVLVGDNDKLIYTDPNTDPYTNGNNDINTNTRNINKEIGSGSYDIGHIFQTSGGGVAQLRSVCSSSKGAGLTGSANPTGDPFYIDYVAHEMGHQFGGNHTFNGTTSACGGGNRASSAAFEPGSGATVMAYAGICGSENLQRNSDAYFHTHSITEINNFINAGGSCSTITNTGNTPPTAEAGDNYTIPARTPFTLVGTANDADSGDNQLLTYVWEQYDLGQSSSSPATMVDNGDRPIFRGYLPTTDPTNTFPKLNDILNGTSTLGISLPTTNRDLNFRLTVRDTKGGVAIDDMLVKVSNTGTPFAITAPTSTTTANGGQTQSIVWDVAGTDVSPINCSQVDIDFSSDNASSFSSIATAVPNNGNANVVIPNVTTNDARIKVKCSNNIFFAMSAKFKVESNGSNQAPAFNNDPFNKADATIDQNYSANIASDASDPNGDVLTFSKISGPDWLNVASDGSLTGIPNSSNLGNNSFTVSVSDGRLDDSATLNINVTDTTPPNDTSFENTTDVNIPDNNSTGVTSSINSTYTGESGTVTVDVNILHTYRGDLVVDVIHPDGTVYNLHNRTGGSANDIIQSYSVNVGAKPGNGEWKLRVRDLAGRDVGKIDSWKITFGDIVPPSDTSFENADNVDIPDNNSRGVTSPITSTYTQNADQISVEVKIVHTYIGDLIVDVIHPDGTVYNLHNRAGGSADNINQTYSVNIGGKAGNGEWQLRVRDRARRDVGYIDSWKITF